MATSEKKPDQLFALPIPMLALRNQITDKRLINRYRFFGRRGNA